MAYKRTVLLVLCSSSSILLLFTFDMWICVKAHTAIEPFTIYFHRLILALFAYIHLTPMAAHFLGFINCWNVYPTSFLSLSSSCFIFYGYSVISIFLESNTGNIRNWMGWVHAVFPFQKNLYFNWCCGSVKTATDSMFISMAYNEINGLLLTCVCVSICHNRTTITSVNFINFRKWLWLLSDSVINFWILCSCYTQKCYELSFIQV